MMVGVVESLYGLWRQYHATIPSEAMASWEGPTLLVMGLLLLTLGRMSKKKDVEGV